MKNDFEIDCQVIFCQCVSKCIILPSDPKWPFCFWRGQTGKKKKKKEKKRNSAHVHPFTSHRLLCNIKITVYVNHGNYWVNISSYADEAVDSSQRNILHTGSLSLSVSLSFWLLWAPLFKWHSFPFIEKTQTAARFRGQRGRESRTEREKNRGKGSSAKDGVSLNSSHTDEQGREAIYCKNNFTKDNKVRNMVFLSAFWPRSIPAFEEESCDSWQQRREANPWN